MQHKTYLFIFYLNIAASQMHNKAINHPDTPRTPKNMPVLGYILNEVWDGNQLVSYAL